MQMGKLSISGRVPRLRASPRHGGAGSFSGYFSVTNPLRAFLKNARTLQKVDLKIS
jgi:hypothetical protein